MIHTGYDEIRLASQYLVDSELYTVYRSTSAFISFNIRVTNRLGIACIAFFTMFWVEKDMF